MKLIAKYASRFPKELQFCCYLQVTSLLPLNNGAPLRKVVEEAKHLVTKSHQKIPQAAQLINALNTALSSKVYKSNAAGNTKRMVF